jgi:hypothetical protein
MHKPEIRRLVGAAVGLLDDVVDVRVAVVALHQATA